MFPPPIILIPVTSATRIRDEILDQVVGVSRLSVTIARDHHRRRRGGSGPGPVGVFHDGPVTPSEERTPAEQHGLERPVGGLAPSPCWYGGQTRPGTALGRQHRLDDDVLGLSSHRSAHNPGEGSGGHHADTAGGTTSSPARVYLVPGRPHPEGERG